MDYFLTACFFLILSIAAVMDFRTMRIADWCWISILALALTAGFVMPGPSWASRAAGFFVVSAPLFLLRLALPGAVGGGDIRLTAACGAFLGWRLTLVGAVFAFLTGGLWAACLLLAGKKDRKGHFALGPFLCVGMLLGWLFGEDFLRWYVG